jgi:hypothetical protein
MAKTRTPVIAMLSWDASVAKAALEIWILFKLAIAYINQPA